MAMNISRKRIEQEAELKVMTLRDVAIKAGIHPQSLYRVLSRGRCTPRILRLIAGALEIDPAKLLQANN